MRLGVVVSWIQSKFSVRLNCMTCTTHKTSWPTNTRNKVTKAVNSTEYITNIRTATMNSTVGATKFFQSPTTSVSSEHGSGTKGDSECHENSSRASRLRSARVQKNVRGLMEMVEKNIVGRETVFQSPFGPRRCVYLDHAASGQSLKCIEDYIRENVLTSYGNTHTTSTFTSSQTTMFRHESKDIIRNAVGASEHDAIIFCGSGATAAIHKIINGVTGGNRKGNLYVFIGPYEHHSNIVPWRDAGAKMIYIPETKEGTFDINYLEEKLREVRGKEGKDAKLIGTFSIASNITGITTDDVAVTIIMHKYDGLALWDYSAAAPHIQIVMNPLVTNLREQGLAKKDAVYFSGHKFTGGPQTPGVLIAKKTLFQNPIPESGGGGTVFFVSKDSHRYLQNIEYREEGGTPAIIESIRLGLAFKLKDAIGVDNIIAKESAYAKRACKEWEKNPSIKLLGPATPPKIGILSFLIEHKETGLYLHHNFVVALLNDLFGIQARGGCMCSGPFSHSLLGIGTDLAKDFEELLLEDSRLDRNHLRRYLEGSAYQIFRPGFTRLSIPYHATLEEVDFVIDAVKLIAEHGYKLLPLYTCNPETGDFHHHTNNAFQNRKWLGWATFDTEGVRNREWQGSNRKDYPNYGSCLEEAEIILTNAHNLCKRRTLPDQSLMFDDTATRLKWFMLPSEALEVMNSQHTNGKLPAVKSPKPFQVKDYSEKQEWDDVTSYYPASVPFQLIQSSWGEEELVSSAKCGIEHDESSCSFCYDNFHSHSNSDTDLELQNTEGATVTGPSICFAKDPEKQGNTSYIYESSNVVDNTEYKTDEPACVTPIPIESNQSANMAHFSNGLISSDNLDIHNRFGLPNNEQGVQHVLECQKPLQVFQQNDYATYEMPVNNYMLINPGINPQQPNTFAYNIGRNDSMESSISCGSPYNFSPNLPDTPLVVDNQFVQPITSGVNFTPSFDQSQQIMETPNSPFPPFSAYQNDMTSSDPYMAKSPTSFDDHVDISNVSSPAACPNRQTGEFNYNMVTKNQVTPSHVMSPTLEPYSLPQRTPTHSSSPLNNLYSETTPTLVSPTNSHSTSSIENELVTVAMRRVTSEIANELKSELRGVISQVEQGIDPDACRERASSFTTKSNKIDALIKRARTMSGHALKRSNTVDDTNNSFISNEDKRFSLAESSLVSGLSNDASKKNPKSREQCTKPANESGRPKGSCCVIKKSVSAPVTNPVVNGNHGNAIQNQKPVKWRCPPKTIMTPTLTALSEFPMMIQDGDKILVCLSGGKDSLSLLHTIRQLQFVMAKKGISFSFGAVTVDPKHSAYDPTPLIPYLKSLDVPYFFEEQEIMTTAMAKGPDGVTSICSYCSRMKRGRIYACARRNGYNVLALGQHLDDLAESFFMSVFHNGLMRTMKASYTVKEGDLRVIRPFVYVREKLLRDFAENEGLPIIPENCPACFDSPKERHRVKQLLAQQEILFPKLYLSLRTAMRPLMAIDRTGMESGKNKHITTIGESFIDEDLA